MKHHILFVFAFFAATGKGSAQQNIKGKVTDKGNKPIPGTVISLLNSGDSSLVKMSITDKNGYYTIAKTGVSQLLIKAEKERFTTQIRPAGSSDSIANFELTTAKVLDEVIITSRKKLIEEKADRTVFNIENSVVAFGGDALEALKKMPGVQVQQQQIKIGDNSGVNIMINGRLQHLAGDELVQFLRSIPANNLSKIELITSPGAKYDASGNAGIINLVTKKNIKEGLNGSITANYNRNSYNSPSGSLSLQYKTGKFNFYTNDNISEFNWLYTNRLSLYYTDQKWEQSVNSEYSNKNGRAQIGVDYDLKKNMILGLMYSRGFGGNDTKEHISSSLFSNSTLPDSLVRSDGTMHEVYKGKNTGNVNYEWRIDTSGKKFSLSADYFSQQLMRERNFKVNSFSGSDPSPKDGTQNKINEDPSITIRSVAGDLDLPYPIIAVSLGGKASFVENDGDYVYQTLTPAGYSPDSSKSNRFLYKEYIQAGYLSAKKKIRDLEILAGIRVEHTDALGLTPATQGALHKNYTQLFPSATIGYKLNEHHNFALSYTRRIERPSYNLLNPFKTYYTENSYQQGNPALQPAITNGFLLSWFINSQYQLRIRINQVNNYWDRVYFTDSSTQVSVVSRTNLGKGMFYVLNFSFSETPAKWWELNGEISGTYNQFWLNAYGNENTYSGISGWIELNNSFYLNRNKTLIAELNGYYYSPRQKDYKLWREMHNIDGGIKALLLDKTLAIGLAFDDPFATSSWFQTNKENGTTEYSYDDQRSLSFSLSYEFGNKNMKAKKERAETIEEIQRAK